MSNQYRRKGRKLQYMGPAIAAAARAAPAVGRVVATAARNWKRVQPLTKRVIGGAGATTAVIGGAGYLAGSRKKAYVKRRYAKKTTGTREAAVAPPSRFGSKIATLNKLQKLSEPKRVLHFQGVAIPDAQVGNYILSNRISTTTAGGLVPMHILSLNSTIQGNTLPTVLRQATISAKGRVSWNALNGYDAYGSVSQYLQAEQSVTGSAVTDYYSKIAQQWHQLKFKFYGAKLQPTTFYVDLVQCTQDFSAVEDEADLNTMTGTHAERYRDSTYGFFQNCVKGLIGNSIANRQNFVNKSTNQPYKVLKTWKYTVAPHMSTETDTSPNTVDATIFIRDGRVCNYEWMYAQNSYDATISDAELIAGKDDDLQNPNAWNRQVVTALSHGTVPINNPHPKARRYIIIRATNQTSIALGSETLDNTPTYDLVYRKGELCGPSHQYV